MNTLLLPVAGASSRFPGMRPKWLLTMPNGNLMYEESIKGIDIKKFSRVIITCLQDHIDNYADYDLLLKSAQKNIHKKVEILVLKRPTSSHAETIYETLVKKKVEGKFFLKDCDNFFNIDYKSGNNISVHSLNNIDLVDAKSKSYVEVDDEGFVNNIIEKNVISNLFCCGGYSFESAKEFKSYYKKLLKSDIRYKNEIYVSHVIYSMLIDGKKFTTTKAENYVDWGILREYRHYCRSFITVFCDIDGVLLENGSKFIKGGWSTPGIKENIDVLAKLQKENKLFLILTTSRPESEKTYVYKKLKKYGLVPDGFIGGLPHSKRVLINDYSATNQYPTAISLNLKRNSIQLTELIDHLTL